MKKDMADRIRAKLGEQGNRNASGNGKARSTSPPPRPSAMSEAWLPPLPLNETPQARPFPLDSLPKPFRRFAEEAAAAIPCPVDYVAAPLLALAGAAIGASRALEIKPGRTERPCLYLAVVGVPSCGKTPCLSFVALPLYDEQTRLFEIYRRERKAHDAGVEGVPKPTERVLYADDVTTEKLAAILQENPRGVAVIREELTGWVRGMDQYRSGKGADKQFWLSAWSGMPIDVRRKNQESGSVRVAHPYLSVVGGIPPDLLTALRGERAVSDGFLDRILFVYPDPFPASGETWGCIPEDCAAQWSDCLTWLLSLEMRSDPEGGPRPHFVRLTSCGRKAWERFTNALTAERNAEATPHFIQGALGKMNSYGARLGLIVHYLRMAANEVEDESVDGKSIDLAAQLVHYFQSHLLRVWEAMDADPRVANARKLLSWVVKQNARSFSRRDAYRGLRGSCKAVEDLEPLLSLLEKHGYIRVMPSNDDGVGRKKSPTYEVNPNLKV